MGRVFERLVGCSQCAHTLLARHFAASGWCLRLWRSAVQICCARVARTRVLVTCMQRLQGSRRRVAAAEVVLAGR